MNNEMRVVARGLSKHFPLHTRGKSSGISPDGWSAMKHLFRTVIKGDPPRVESVKGAEMLKALDGVSFEVERGEILGIIGRNGAGKSTLLKVLSRIYQPTAGQLEITGRLVSMLELGIGFAPEMTVRENLQIHGRLAGVAAAQIAAEENHILKQAGLTEFRDMPLAGCPSGSAVQLAFASMINLHADVILADEVLAVGDAAFRHECETHIRQAAETGTAVLFVTHDMHAVRRLCTKVMWIDKGQLVTIGPTEEVVDAYVTELLSGRFLTPPGNEDSSCRILDLRLLDENRETIGALQMTENGYIDCLYQVRGNDLAVSLQIEIWQGKNFVFASAPEVLPGFGASGTFHAAMFIPAHFLNEATYRATCKIRTQKIGNKGLDSELVSTMSIDLTVMNPHPERSVWNSWSWGRDGLVCPMLKWGFATGGKSV